MVAVRSAAFDAPCVPGDNLLINWAIFSYDIQPGDKVGARGGRVHSLGR